MEAVADTLSITYREVEAVTFGGMRVVEARAEDNKSVALWTVLLAGGRFVPRSCFANPALPVTLQHTYNASLGCIEETGMIIQQYRGRPRASEQAAAPLFDY